MPDGANTGNLFCPDGYHSDPVRHAAKNMKDFLRLFLPHHHATVTLAEKLRGALAGGIAILWLGLLIEFLPRGPYPVLMLGSTAASAVLLFAVPHSPMAQPWNLVVGHAISALAGWIISLLIADPLIAAAIAVALAILLMHLLDALHPPGAATALTVVLGASQFHLMGGLWLAGIVAMNAAVSLAFAVLINNLLPGRHYPAPHQPPAPQAARIPPAEITVDDIEAALEEMDSVIDVSEEDLLEIYSRAMQHAQQRPAR